MKDNKNCEGGFMSKSILSVFQNDEYNLKMCSQNNTKCFKKQVHFLAQNVSPQCAFTHLSYIQPYSFNKETNKWEYYKPLHEDKNVISYHSTLLLSWGTHLNILHITSSYWSFYL